MTIEKGKPRPILIRNLLFTALLLTGVLFLLAVLILKTQNILGVMYQFGLGVSQDYAEAAKWYRRAAEWGYADAQDNLGVMYAQGQGVPQDYTEAVKWCRKAAEQGFVRGQNDLAWLLATCPDDQIRDGERALSIAKNVVAKDPSAASWIHSRQPTPS